MTHKEKIIKLLSDGNWHSNIEFNEIAFRYSARLYELRKQGYVFNKKRDPQNPTQIEWWQLVGFPPA